MADFKVKKPERIAMSQEAPWRLESLCVNPATRYGRALLLIADQLVRGLVHITQRTAGNAPRRPTGVSHAHRGCSDACDVERHVET